MVGDGLFAHLGVEVLVSHKAAVQFEDLGVHLGIDIKLWNMRANMNQDMMLDVHVQVDVHQGIGKCIRHMKKWT